MSNGLQHLDRSTPETKPASDLTVDLWTRRPVCGPRTTVIDRLSSLRTAGTLDDFSVTTWPDEIVISDRNQHSELVATIEEFETWADENGVSLRPPFQTRTASLLVGESKEVLRTPMMLASMSDGEDIVGVYPCTQAGHTWTIPEFLDVLEDDETALGGATEEPSLPATGYGTP